MIIVPPIYIALFLSISIIPGFSQPRCLQKGATYYWREQPVGHDILWSIQSICAGGIYCVMNYDYANITQLCPLTIQKGDHVNITSNIPHEDRKNVLPVIASNTQWLTCQNLQQSNSEEGSSQIFTNFSVGSNFLIHPVTDTSSNQSQSCLSGMRLIVNMLDHKCSSSNSHQLCSGHGKCFWNDTSSYFYSCACEIGYKGEFCEENDWCSSSPCSNNSICENDPDGYQCFCENGYSGKYCHINYDDCLSNPCKNGGTCRDGVASFTCVCPIGLTGDICEENIDDCIDNSCTNNGMCIDGLNGFVCLCQPGYAGKDCGTQLDECTSSPCGSNGYCEDIVNDFVCQCYPPYTGKRCTDLICNTYPCKNDGNCTHTDISPGYVCSCPVGFTGERCDDNINDCVPKAPNQLPCSGRGLCTDNVNGYTCFCEPDWIGTDCQQLIDDCIGNICQHNSTCIDGVNSYRCSCLPGWTGAHCDVEINECEVLNPCKNGGHCSDLFNGFRCNCSEGWSGADCGDNINECKHQTKCRNNATCVDLVNGYSCACPARFTGQFCEENFTACSSYDNPCQYNSTCIQFTNNTVMCLCAPGFHGINCSSNIDECESSPCINGSSCEDVVDGYVCNCLPGQTGRRCEYLTESCLSDPCYNGATCINHISGFLCECPIGYAGSQCQENQEECSIQAFCYNGGSCYETGNGPICRCPSGFTGKDCRNITDACRNNTCQNNATCTSHGDFYTCSCQAGYTGLSCEVNVTGYDDCVESRCGNGSCVDSIGGYTCLCKPGFTGKNCSIEVNECLSHPCLNNGSCIDLMDHYQCLCLPGFKGKQCESMEVFGCKGEPCLNGATCNEEVGTNFSCLCKSGYAGTLCQINVDDCSSLPCRNNGTCLDGIGSFFCSCPAGWTGDDCSYDLNECHNYSCQNGGKCVPNPEATGFRCFCSSGFGGLTCEKNYNDCLNNSCLNGATCQDGINNFTCICPFWAHGIFCENLFTMGTKDHMNVSAYSSSSYSYSLTNNSYTTHLISSSVVSTVTMTTIISSSTPDNRSSFTTTGLKPKESLCDCIKCLNGGTCRDFLDANQMQNFKCICPVPYGGHRCEYELRIYYPSFSQPSKLRVNIGQTQYIDLYMGFSFKSPGGLLSLLSGLQHLVNVTLIDDHTIMAEAFCTKDKSFIIVLNLTQQANQQELHLNFSRDFLGCSLFMSLNEEQDLVEDQINLENSSSINAIILGAQGVSSTSFTGCLYYMVVNQNELPLITDTTIGTDIGSCSISTCTPLICKNGGTCMTDTYGMMCACPPSFTGTFCEKKHCEVNPCHHGGTCISSPDNYDVICLCPAGRYGADCSKSIAYSVPYFASEVYGYSSFLAYAKVWGIATGSIFKLEFAVHDEASYNSSLLFFTGQKGLASGVGSDYLALALEDGYAVFMFNLGSGYAKIKSRYPLTYGNFSLHSIKFGNYQRQGFLQVNHQDNITGSSAGHLSQMNSNSMLYIGGTNLERSLLPEELSSYGQFIGCVYTVLYKTLNSARWVLPGYPAGVIESGRNVQQCPYKQCDQFTCRNGGICETLRAGIGCTCPTGWSGLTCDEPSLVSICNQNNHNCSQGSTCVERMNEQYSCLCPLGKMGKFCEQDMELRYPLFADEESHMTFQGYDMRIFTDIVIEFKPKKLNGLLFYAAQRLAEQSGDFIAISLYDGRVHVRLRLGDAAPFILASLGTASKGSWNRLHLERLGHNMSLTFNGLTLKERISGTYSMLDVTPQIYLGGLPELTALSPLAMQGDPVTYEGCVRKLIVNRRNIPLSLKEAVSGINILDCDDGLKCGLSFCYNGGSCVDEAGTNCSCQPEFYGESCLSPVICRDKCMLESSCVEYNQTESYCLCPSDRIDLSCSTNVDVNASLHFRGVDTSYMVIDNSANALYNMDQFSISFHFRTNASDGLILWIGEAFSADYFGIGLSCGQLKAVWSFGSITSKELYAESAFMNDGLWHHVSLISNNRQLEMSVDNRTVATDLSGSYKQLNTGGSVFIGTTGYRASVAEHTMFHYKKPYHGCLKDLKINNWSLSNSTYWTSNVGLCS